MSSDKKKKQALIKAGYTKYQVESIINATNFLGTLFASINYKGYLIKQFEYLNRDKSITEEDWKAWIIQWEGLMLGDGYIH